MLGTGLPFGCGRGEDPFSNSANASRTHQKQRAKQLRRAQSDVTPSQCSTVKEIPALVPPPREPENRTGSSELSPTLKPLVSPLSNFKRFLQSIKPSVSAQYLSKTTMKGWRPCDVESQPFFVLGDLWESFKEWSAYGAGVPLIFNDSVGVVQYYVPYLSGIQIYGDSTKLSVVSRRPDDDSDSDFRDSSSDGSSDCEHERGLKNLREQRVQHTLSTDISRRMDRLSFREQPNSLQEDFSSDEGESVNSQGRLIFEYLERDPPYSREPLADKILDLAFHFPELKTLRSCDVSPSSWISVAWYPIYRIPTGPTLKDLDACFLTYHSLYTPVGGVQSAQSPVVTRPSETDGVPRMLLPVIGLATYKLKGPMWTPNGGFERQLAASLLQAADDLLRPLKVNHPDFLFFSRR
ncbi:hypothetical protein UlMin_040483 [Ulmus minor]